MTSDASIYTRESTTDHLQIDAVTPVSHGASGFIHANFRKSTYSRFKFSMSSLTVDSSAMATTDLCRKLATSASAKGGSTNFASVYTSCYCEENVWWQCKQYMESTAAFDPSIEAFAVFVSNPTKTVAIFEQKSSSRDDGAVIWDYHVLFLVRSRIPSNETDTESNLVLFFDLDSRLAFPCPFDLYWHKAIARQPNMRLQFTPRFRIVSAEHFVHSFASDRSHMIKDDGSYSSPPPSYSVLGGGAHNLDKFWDMQHLEQPEIDFDRVGWASKLLVKTKEAYGCCVSSSVFKDFFYPS